MTSIFDDDTNKMTGNWWKKNKVGDKLEGTFESKKRQLNPISGEEQNVYEVRTKEGELYLVGGNVGIDSQMQNVKAGQIVGFEFTEERPNKKNPSLNATKVVQVYANPKMINEEWLIQQKRLQDSQLGIAESFIEQSETDKATEVTSEEAEEIINGTSETEETQPFMTESEKKKLIVQITKLATNKLGATSAEDVKNKTMESTELAFIDANLEKIVEALEELPDRK